MKKMKYLWLLLALMVLPVQAQEAVLNKAKRYLDASKGLQIDYELFVGDDSDTGTYYALGDAFYLESGGLKAWHQDGNLWVYLAQNGEVNLSHPEKEDLQELNPLLNLEQISSKTFTLTEGKVEGYTTLRAVPKSRRGSEIEWLTLVVDKSGQPLAMTVKQRSIELPISLTISKFTKGATESMKRKDFFSYTANKLPGVAVIDLR